MTPPAGRGVTRFAPSGPLRGELKVPGDKSISHRAALLAAMSEGEVTISGYLDAEDTRSSLTAVARLGARVADGRTGEVLDPGRAEFPESIAITGVGLRGPRPAAIDVGNAGTLIRLLPGWLAGQEGSRSWRLDGDDSIRSRPMARVAEPLRQMGACIAGVDGDRAPLEVTGSRLTGIEYEMPIASAQVKSCLLLAGLLAHGATTVTEPGPSRDHTERMLAAAGAEIAVSGSAITVDPADGLRLDDEIEVPGDISSAAFILVAATLIPGSEIVLPGVGVNPTRTGLLDVLLRMGGSVKVLRQREVGGEPVADLAVTASTLTGTEVSGDEVPRAIDELPIIALAGACAEGRTVISDAAELRRKETDRIETVAGLLTELGVPVETRPDGWVIEGAGSPAALRGGSIHAHGDHRIAMLGAVAGLAVPGGVEVTGMEAAEVSYRGFESDLASVVRAP